MDSQTRFEMAMRSLETTRQKIIELKTAFSTDFEKCRSMVSAIGTPIVQAFVNETKLEVQLPLVSVVETPTMPVIGDAPINRVMLAEQVPVVSTVETPTSQVTSTAVDSQTRFERAMRSLETTRQRMTEVRAACKSDFEKCLSVICVARTHLTSTPSREIKLEEQVPVVECQVAGTAADSQARFERAMMSLETARQRMTETRATCKSGFEKCLSAISVGMTHPSSALISKMKLEERLPIEHSLEAPIRQVTSALYSEVKVEEQLPVIEAPNVQDTYAPISGVTLSERLSFILKNLPPLSQLPRFTAAEIKVSAVRFEQAIVSLVALSKKIAETKASFKQAFAGLEVTAGGRIRAASVLKHSPPQSPVSLWYSIFTHGESEGSEYEDSDEEDCSATPESDYSDSEPESEQSDIEGAQPLSTLESKKALIMREKREALAATLTDDMLFNLLLMDCTTRPHVPDSAPVAIRRWISMVPIDWEPRYVGKYRVQWW